MTPEELVRAISNGAVIEQQPKNSIGGCGDEIIVDRNNITFNTEINESTAMRLISEMRHVAGELIIDSLDPFNDMIAINLFINSPGGSVTDSLAIYDFIQRLNNKVRVNTIVSGMAASGASIITCAGSKRFITENSTMLIHQLRSWIYGPLDKIKEMSSNCDKLEKMIEDIYLNHTKLTKKDLKSILKKDIYLTSEECLKYGLVDEIVKNKI